MRDQLVVDTGPLVALLSSRDEHHARCVELLSRVRRPLATCWPVLTEAAWLLRSLPSGCEKLLGLVQAGVIELHEIRATDIDWVSGFHSRYASVGVQLADACVMLLARRLDADVFTLDRRNFAVYRHDDGRPVTVVPTD